jgi:predicted small secreted protein
MTRKPRRLVPLLVAAALGLTACTNAVSGAPSGVEIGPLTTAEATSGALTSFAESAATRYQGTLKASDGSDFTVDVTATSTGEVFGNITVDRLGATILVLDKTLYLKGKPEFWAAMAARFGVSSGDGTALGNRWVKLPTVLLGIEFADIFTPDLVSQTAGKATKDAGGALPTETTTAGTVTGLEVPVDGGTVYLAKEAPHGVVAIALDEIGSAENTKARDLLVAVTDVSATINKTYTDLAAKAKNELGTAVDALTTITQGGNRFDACGAPSCTLVVDITNPSKKAVKVHLRADWTGDNAPLGSCEQTVGPVQPGASATMKCAIKSKEWGAFYQRANSVAGSHPYGAVWTALALADPPDAAPLAERGAAKPADPKARKEGDSGQAVYEIAYADGVWKYGVVSARYWRDHAKDQLRGCLGTTKSVCTYSLVTTADNPVSAYALATQLVATYKQEKGTCPAGQWVSCGK